VLCIAWFFFPNYRINNGHTAVAAASGKTNFISTKMKLLNCADIHTLDPMPCTAHSAELNTNVSNIQNKRRHSEEAGTDDLSGLFLHFCSYLCHWTHIWSCFCLTTDNINLLPSFFTISILFLCKLTNVFGSICCKV